MQSQADNLVRDGVVESFWTDLTGCWQRLPNRGLFLGLLSVWLVLFHLLGNSTFGYVDTPSLLTWLWRLHSNPSDPTGQWTGVLAFFAVLVLFWMNRMELVALPLKSWAPGLALLVFAGALHVVGYLIQQSRVSVVALLVGIYGIMGLAWGRSWLRASFAIYMFTVFIVPLGGVATALTFNLRLLVTVIVEFIVRTLLGMDVVRVGTGLFDASRTYGYDVAAACSGMRSLTAMFFIATVYGFVLFRTSWRWVAMLAAAFPLAVIGNTLRLLCIVVAADMAGQKNGDWVHENTLFSLLPYVPVILGIALLGRWLTPKPSRISPPEVPV